MRFTVLLLLVSRIEVNVVEPHFTTRPPLLFVVFAHLAFHCLIEIRHSHELADAFVVVRVLLFLHSLHILLVLFPAIYFAILSLVVNTQLIKESS
jgi:hypothetical protein